MMRRALCSTKTAKYTFSWTSPLLFLWVADDESYISYFLSRQNLEALVDFHLWVKIYNVDFAKILDFFKSKKV